MLKSISQKLDHMMMPTSVGTDSKRPIFDIWLGYELIKDNAVSYQTKLKAFGIGIGVSAVLLAGEIFAYHYMRLSAHVLEAPRHIGLTLLSAVLFSLLAVLRVAPKEQVTRLRYERFPVIPLNQGSVAMANARPVRHSSATPRYAVIPRRQK